MRLIVTAVLVLIVTRATAAEKPKTEMEKVRATVDVALDTLAKRKYERFIKGYLSRDLLLVVLKDQSLDSASKGFGLAPTFETCLRTAVNIEPTLNKDEDSAVYEYHEKTGNVYLTIKVGLQRIDGRWYIKYAERWELIVDSIRRPL